MGLARREARAQRRLQVGVAGGGAANRLHQLGIGRLLEHVTTYSRLQRAAGEGELVLHRQHDHLGLGRGGADVGHGVEAGAPRHVEIEDQHGRLVPARVADRHLGVAGLGNHLEIGLGVKQQPQGVADHGVIVGEDDRGRLDLPLALAFPVRLHDSEATCARGPGSGVHASM